MSHPPTLRAAALLVVFAGDSFYKLILFLQARRSIRDLFEDLRDGHNLISLLEVLTGEQLVSYVRSHEDMINYYMNESIHVCWMRFCNYLCLIVIASHGWLSDNILSFLLFLQPREKGQMRFHMLHNIDTALHFLRCKNVKLVNIRSEDIVDGNPKLTLGLIWTIILHFQVSDAIFLLFAMYLLLVADDSYLL